MSRGRGSALALLVTLATAAPVLAQCPADLVHVGRLERRTPGIQVSERARFTIPPTLTLDPSYRQVPSPPGHGGRARSRLSEQSIPPGICLVPDGVGSYGWAVSDPRMIDAHTLEMYLYCTHDRNVSTTSTGCGVWVDVYVKTRSAPR
jgi:hypothetical protein